MSASHKMIKLLAGLLGLSGVALGAFGAHALKPTLTAHGTADVWETAVIYHLIHAVAVFAAAVALPGENGPTPSCLRRWLARAAACWAAGVVLFSGSLYALALGGPRWLGPVTPLGGLLLLLGWGFVVLDGLCANPGRKI
jgi:uncharacterized membrane protein YgdD (TMEM256/DUF423 family)